MSLSIVGLGPGGPEHRTAAAERAVREADVVIGYGPYVDQCADLLDGQEVVRGRMGEELGARRGGGRRAPGRARAWRWCRPATRACTAWPPARSRCAAPGRACLRVEVIPGVTAALAVAARVGAPLADDWATLSLSDLHVPWATVERRLTALAASGIALALYNPRSATRTEPFDARAGRSCARTARRTRPRSSRPTSRAPTESDRHHDPRRTSTRRR